MCGTLFFYNGENKDLSLSRSECKNKSSCCVVGLSSGVELLSRQDA